MCGPGLDLRFKKKKQKNKQQTTTNLGTYWDNRKNFNVGSNTRLDTW